MNGSWRGIFVALLAVGVALMWFTGYELGPWLAGLAFAALVLSLLRKRRFMAAAVAVVLSSGSVLLPAIANKQPDLPPVEDVVAAADEYARMPAEGDLGAYRDSVNRADGVAIEDAFRVESDCIDWDEVSLSIEPHPVAEYVAVVTFFAGSRSVTRDFQWTVSRDPLFLSGRWVATVDDSCAAAS